MYRSRRLENKNIGSRRDFPESVVGGDASRGESHDVTRLSVLSVRREVRSSISGVPNKGSDFEVKYFASIVIGV